jgi:hypothetical protein
LHKGSPLRHKDVKLPSWTAILRMLKNVRLSMWTKHGLSRRFKTITVLKFRIIFLNENENIMKILKVFVHDNFERILYTLTFSLNQWFEYPFVCEINR